MILLVRFATARTVLILDTVGFEEFIKFSRFIFSSIISDYHEEVMHIRSTVISFHVRNTSSFVLIPLSHPIR